METVFVREVRAMYSGRNTAIPSSLKERIFEPESLANIIRDILPDNTQEHFIVINLDASNTITSYTVATTGLVNSSQVHPREVFKTAVLSNAVAIIIAHNHPSGNNSPSKEDDEVTERLKDCGKLLGIKVLDHIIVTEESHYSYQYFGKM